MLTAAEKYLFKPFPGSSHNWALDQICKLPKDIKILDIGTGNGQFGAKLKSLGYTNIYALEIDPAARAEAEKIYKKTSVCIEELGEQNFDLILLLDVIEHMTAPEDYLKKISSYTKTDSMILVSVPNIAHYSIRLMLLFGFFEYTNRGLLDKTHYSFFNRRRILNAANNIPGFILSSYSVSAAPVEYYLPERIWNSSAYKLLSNLRAFVQNLLPGLLGFQHLVVLKKQ